MTTILKFTQIEISDSIFFFPTYQCDLLSEQKESKEGEKNLEKRRKKNKNVGNDEGDK